MSGLMSCARTSARQNSKSFGRLAESLVSQRSLISKQRPVTPSVLSLEYAMSLSRHPSGAVTVS